MRLYFFLQKFFRSLRVYAISSLYNKIIYTVWCCTSFTQLAGSFLGRVNVRPKRLYFFINFCYDEPQYDNKQTNVFARYTPLISFGGFQPAIGTFCWQLQVLHLYVKYTTQYIDTNINNTF